MSWPQGHAPSTTDQAGRVQWGSTLKLASFLRRGPPLTEVQGGVEGLSKDVRRAPKGVQPHAAFNAGSR